jgi:hypothetical protein
MKLLWIKFISIFKGGYLFNPYKSEKALDLIFIMILQSNIIDLKINTIILDNNSYLKYKNASDENNQLFVAGNFVKNGKTIYEWIYKQPSKYLILALLKKIENFELYQIIKEK